MSFLPEEDFETDPSSVEVLIVGRTAPDALTDVLHRHGWDVRHCPGPRHRKCPLVEHQPCALRDRSDAVVLYVDATGVLDPVEARGLIQCGAHPASPAVVVVAGDVTAVDPLEAIPVFKAGIAPEVVADAVEGIHRQAVE